MTFSLWLSTVAFAMTWWWCSQCASDPPALCGYCTDDGDNVSLTISGMSNGTYCSGCSFFNATFILPRVTGQPCVWRKTGVGGNCQSIGEQYVLEAVATAIPPSGNYGYIVNVQGTYFYQGLGHTEYSTRRWNSGAQADYDCTAQRVTSAYLYFQDQGCVGWSTLSVVVN